MSVIDSFDSKYKMLYAGEWLPVVNMIDAGRHETPNPLRAVSAVLYAAPGVWVATSVTPGDIMERDDRDPESRDWETLN